MTTADDWTFATLEISGPGVDPTAVTRELGVTPTATGASAARPPGGWGYWTLASRGHVPGNRLADHLRWLADRLGVATPTLRDLAAAGRARLLAQGTPETWHLDAGADETERARLGLPLSFLVFVKGDPEIQVGHVEFRNPGGAA